MKHFWNKWKRDKESDDDRLIAQLNLKIYADKLECNIRGDEVKVGGALVTLMLRHAYIYSIINNAVVATNLEISRRTAAETISDLFTTFNPN